MNINQIESFQMDDTLSIALFIAGLVIAGVGIAGAVCKESASVVTSFSQVRVAVALVISGVALCIVGHVMGSGIEAEENRAHQIAFEESLAETYGATTGTSYEHLQWDWDNDKGAEVILTIDGESEKATIKRDGDRLVAFPEQGTKELQRVGK